MPSFCLMLHHWKLFWCENRTRFSPGGHEALPYSGVWITKAAPRGVRLLSYRLGRFSSMQAWIRALTMAAISVAFMPSYSSGWMGLR